MHLTCPHCHNPIEVVPPPGGDEILCPSCGSTFRLDAEATKSLRSAKFKVLGRFELLEPVGAGAFGTVYKARDPQLDRIVAVKVPRAGNLSGPEDLDRFFREGRSAAQLHHPSIVPVHEVGQAEGVPYLVSEFVEGPTLSDVLTSREIPTREAAELIAAVAEALQYAHEHGVVHRDVKPSNIMFDAKGRPNLMDFGLAKRDAGEITMTQDGQVLGTPAFMPPEQARGDASKVDGRSDVYSLGVVLYRLLAGELPFRGNTRMLLQQVLHDDPRSPRKLNDRVPRDLETICLKAMAKEPARRYPTAGAFADDLRRWLSDVPISARPSGPVERAWRWTRRHPTAAALIVTVFVAGLSSVAAGVGFAYSGRLQTTNRDLKKANRAAVQARGETQEALDLANRYLYFLRINQAQTAWRDNLAARASTLLDECPPEQRGWEWRYLDQVRKAPLWSLGGLAGSVWSVAFSPDGRRIASGGGDGTVRVWDADTGKEMLTLRGHTGFVQSVAFSPDGRRIASGGKDGAVRVWDADSGKEMLTPRGHTREVQSVAFSPDGRRIASGVVDGTVRVWDADSGKEMLTLRGHTGPVYSVAFSPDGRRIASGSFDRAVRVWDAETGQEALTLRGHTGPVYSVAFSPDGRRIASGCKDGAVRVWDADTGKEMLTLHAHTRGVMSVAFSPDGRRIASGSNVEVRVWDVDTGQEALTLRGHTGAVMSVAFSPDGRRIASGSLDRAVRVWDATTGQEALTLRGHTGFVLSVVFGPDGRRIASSGGDGEVRVWDADTGKEMLTLRGHIGDVPSVTFSPDGRRIASSGGDGEVRVWDADTGKEMLTLRGHTGPVYSVAFSPDGRRIASGSFDRAVRVWDADTGQEALTLRGHTGAVMSVAFSPDGRRIASGGDDGEVRVWDANTGKEMLTLGEHRGFVPSVAFSPDGRRIASSGGDGEVRVWDADTGQEALTLHGHIGAVPSVAFSPDGRRIASSGGDWEIRVWDADTGTEALTLHGHTGAVMSVAFSPDGRRIASGGDREVRVWGAQPETAESPAQRRDLADRHWPVWQRWEAEDCLERGLWFAAAWHLDRLVKRDPDDAYLRVELAAARNQVHPAPKDNAERLRLAMRAYEKSLHAASARLFAEALASAPKLADDRLAQHAYNAACAAALAGCGMGKDDPPPDAAARAKLRRQALEWLQSELAAWAKVFDTDPAKLKAMIAPTLKHWKEDPDLVGLLDESELAKLPDEERAAFQKLWTDVDELLSRATAHK